jgi:predicted oxidoreductase
MKQISLSSDFSISQMVHGQMRINDWHLSSYQLLGQMKTIASMGIDTFDNADIYGNYTCEALVGGALALDPSFRNSIKIITKCGICIQSDKFPKRQIQFYDYSYDYIVGR